MKQLLDWVVGSWRTIGFVAVSTVPIYLSVVVALRVGERRTLSEMSVFDFAVAVAVGSIIGRVSTARSPTYVQGLAALLTLLVSHYLITFGRARSERVERWVERSPRVVVRDGEILPSNLRGEHLTRTTSCVRCVSATFTPSRKSSSLSSKQREGCAVRAAWRTRSAGTSAFHLA